MFISVLSTALNSNPWLAVQWNENLQALLSDNDYDAGVNRNFTRSPNDHFIQTKQIHEIATPGSNVTAHVFELIAVLHSVTIAPISPIATTKKKNGTTPPKKKSARKSNKPILNNKNVAKANKTKKKIKQKSKSKAQKLSNSGSSTSKATPKAILKKTKKSANRK